MTCELWLHEGHYGKYGTDKNRDDIAPALNDRPYELKQWYNKIHAAYGNKKKKHLFTFSTQIHTNFF